MCRNVCSVVMCAEMTCACFSFVSVFPNVPTASGMPCQGEDSKYMAHGSGSSRNLRQKSSLLLDKWGACFNPLALELDIYSLAHHLCKMCIFYEPRSVTLGNTRHFVEE